MFWGYFIFKCLSKSFTNRPMALALIAYSLVHSEKVSLSNKHL